MLVSHIFHQPLSFCKILEIFVDLHEFISMQKNILFKTWLGTTEIKYEIVIQIYLNFL